ncbi:MAG: hypothetical protein HY231_12175 [Acidobacteria bacterium]|nr:hypothetical protein [Acidobacteriota bacterium]
MADGKQWSVFDSWQNQIYLTEERWQHILAHHPEMAAYEAELQATVKKGQRQPDLLSPQKYRYSMAFENLEADNTHLVAMVLFRHRDSETGIPTPNNYVVTAYQKAVG